MPTRGALGQLTWTIFTGENDKYNPEDSSGKYLHNAQNIDSYSVYRGAGKIHGSKRVSASGTGSAWNSLNWFAAENLNGNEQYRLVGTSSGTLYDIDLTSGELTVLASGYSNEALSSFVYNDLLFLCSPNNAPRKLDMQGNESQWGINAPGTNQTVLEGFEDASVFSMNGSNTWLNNPLTPPDVVNSLLSVQVNKDDPTVSGAELSRTGLHLNLIPAGDGIISTFFYIPGGSLNLFPASGTCVQIQIGTGGFTNSSSYRFSKGNIQEGWNLLSYLYSYPDSHTGSSGTYGNITDVTYSLFLTPGTTESGFLWDNMFYFDSGTPSGICVTGTGPMINDTVTYRVSYVTSYGVESNAGPISNSILVSGTVQLHNIPISPDSQVIKRHIYRDLDGDQTFLRVATIYDNVTTSYLDNSAHDSLSLTTPYYAQDPANKDHTPPSKMRDATFWNGSVVAINENQPFRLDIFQPGQPEAVRGNAALFTDLANIGLEKNPLGLMILEKTKTYRMIGQTAIDSVMEIVDNEVGTLGRRSHTTLKYNVASVHSSGPFFVYQGPDNWAFAGAVRTFWENLDSQILPEIFMVHDQRRLQLIFFCQTYKDGPYDKIKTYSYAKIGLGKTYYNNEGISATDPREGAWLSIVPPASIDPRCGCAGLTAASIPAVYVGCSDGFVYHLFDEDTHNWSTMTSEAPVVSILETNDAPFGQSASGRGRPRYLEISGDFSATATTTLNVVVEGRDRPNGPVMTSGVFDVVFTDSMSSRMVPIPNSVFGNWGRVRITNSGLNEFPQFYNITLHYIPIGGLITGPR